ncbi:MAG: EpsI family protein [Phycisphaerales bacterium]|nr:EpsI family protein [Phycisphaerales bacterium]
MDWRRLRHPAFVLSVGLLIVSAGGLSAAVSALKLHTRKEAIEVDRKTASVSTETPSWKQIGKDQIMPVEVLEELGTRNYLSRHYVETNPKNKERPLALELHLAYYTGMVDTVPHVPERCMVGGGMELKAGPMFVPVPIDQSGWNVDDAATSDLRRALGDEQIVIRNVRLGPNSAAPGNRVRLPRGIEELTLRVSEYRDPRSKQRMFAGYFFIANGGLTPNAEGVRLLAFDLKSYYAYYMKVQVSSTQVQSAEELAQAAGSLLGELMGDIMLCVPDWTDVIRGDYPPDNPLNKKNAGGGKN